MMYCMQNEYVYYVDLVLKKTISQHDIMFLENSLASAG